MASSGPTLSLMCRTTDGEKLMPAPKMASVSRVARRNTSGAILPFPAAASTAARTAGRSPTASVFASSTTKAGRSRSGFVFGGSSGGSW